MKGLKFEITSNITKMNGKFECYNVTEDMIHLARINNKGKKLSCKNINNLVNIRISDFTNLTSNRKALVI